MKDGRNSTAVWKTAAMTGICLIVIGAGAEYVDIGTHFKFEFISDYFEFFMWAELIGTLVSFTGLIGWARHLERKSRIQMAAIAFVSPWIACLLGYPIDGMNVHGAAPLVLVLIIPASILAVVLLLLRGAKSQF